MTTRPLLPCDECGHPLIPAHVRTYFNPQTNTNEDHPDDCACGNCEWAWYESGDVTVCVCGTHACVTFFDWEPVAMLVDHNKWYENGDPNGKSLHHLLDPPLNNKGEDLTGDEFYTDLLHILEKRETE